MKIVRDDQYYSRAAWFLISAFALFRLGYAGLIPLAPDETNYWQWGRHLDWGYHDQAPLIGWSIRFFTEFLGNTEIAVRLPSILAIFIASMYLIAIAGRWFGGRAAFDTAVLTQGILLFNVGGILATADGLQAAGWAAASYHVARAYENGTARQWLLGGFWFGFGLLAKFTMVIFLPSAYIYGLLSARHRFRLASVWPYIGVGLGLLMFAPVVCWNAAHGWNSVRHVAYLGGANDQFALHFKYLGEYFAAQLGLVSPLVLLLILWAWHTVFWKRLPAGEWLPSYLFWTSCLMVGSFALLSLHTRVYGNWPGAGYLTASVLCVAVFRHGAAGQRVLSNKIWYTALAIAYLLTALVLLQAVYPVLPLPVALDRTSLELYGWQELGRRTAAAQASMPDPEKTFVFGTRYQVASELAFYMPGQPETVSINKWTRPNVYDYWWREADLLGHDGVGVTRRADDLNQLSQVFERVEPPEKIEVFRDGILLNKTLQQVPVQVFYLFRCYGFQGGLHWQPRDKSDIRVSP